MNTFSKTLSEKLSKIKPKDLVYPGILLAFSVVVLILFFTVAQFITKNINNAFLSPMTMESSSLNMGNYTLVAKKLGITVSTSPSQQAVAPQPDKSTLKISVVNASGQKGVAGTLATSLKDAGYSNVITSNQSNIASGTTIVINESKASFGTGILEEVKKAYPNATISTVAGTTEFDVVVSIGGK
jgi:hypothetical protein